MRKDKTCFYRSVVLTGQMTLTRAISRAVSRCNHGVPTENTVGTPSLQRARNSRLIALNSGEIEMVAAFSGACEAMGLRKLSHSGSGPISIAHTCLPLNCSHQHDPAHGSTRKMIHIDVKSFLLTQWSARHQVRVVWAGANEHLADC